MAEWTLRVVDHRSETRWRWVLEDARGRFLQDQEVTLDPAARAYASYMDLPKRLRLDARSDQEVLAELGAWMGDQVLGKVGIRLAREKHTPGRVLAVRVPPEALGLLDRPLELAYVGGRPLGERGWRLVYTREGAETGMPSEKSAEGPLRMLGVFSLPRETNPLNLRQERQRLERLVAQHVQTQGRAAQWRRLQYGATREELEEVLQEAPGWDVVHFSGHGLAGELALEQTDGTRDMVGAEELLGLLALTRERVKLVVLSACYSGAGDLHAARAQIGLEEEPRRATGKGGADAGDAEGAGDVRMLPSLGQRLAEELDCAVVAMRYAVTDQVATDLAVGLYERLLEKGQALPQALTLAMEEAVTGRGAGATLARSTAVLLGTRAPGTRLQAPARDESFRLPETGLFGFPRAPERFVGRLMPLLRARQALAPESEQTGVVFYGMPGGGKTACALELAHGYDRRYVQRFTGFAWWQGPKEGDDISGALVGWAEALERQLPGLALVGLLDDPQAFRRQALPRLKGWLEGHAVLLVLDNLEGLLSAEGSWRDARWGEVLGALTEHTGLSRVVLTTRRLSETLRVGGRVACEAISALSFPESVVLAREMPRLAMWFVDEAGRKRLQRVLGAVQGHPKLLELAEGLAGDVAGLEAQLARAEDASAAGEESQLAFLRQGESTLEAEDYVHALSAWTEWAAARLGSTARLLGYSLARLEEEDRSGAVLRANWEDLLKRLCGERGSMAVGEPVLGWARKAREEEGWGLEPGLGELAAAALIAVEAGQGGLALAANDPGLLAALAQDTVQDGAVSQAPESVAEEDAAARQARVKAALARPGLALQRWLAAEARECYRMHPGVAEALLRNAPEGVAEAVDQAVGDWFLGMMQWGGKREGTGGGPLVQVGCRGATPYLLRAGRWAEASTVLEQLIHGDPRAATLGFALPRLRAIVAHTRGMARELVDQGALAKALWLAGKHEEAEALERDRIIRAAKDGRWRVASTAAGNLCSVLLSTGSYREALQVAGEKAEYSRRAGLGPWTQMADAGRGLQARNALGQYAEVLGEVARLRQKMAALAEEGEADEAMQPWRVREGILAEGHRAAAGLKHWDEALALNAEIRESQRRRGAGALEFARTCLNNYGSLLSLGRRREARGLLEECLLVFEEAQQIGELGAVYSALAEVEGVEGGAVQLEERALRYTYQAGEPEACANSHHNLGNYRQCGGDATGARAQWLAAGAIRMQCESGQLAATVRNLALAGGEAAWPSWGEVVTAAERTEGVRLGTLWTRLGGNEMAGEEALRRLREMVDAERAAQASRQEDAVRRAVQESEPLLHLIAAVARGEEGPRQSIEAVLRKLEEKGWHIADGVHRVWAGDRDAETLTEGLDAQDTALLWRVVELLREEPRP